MKYMTFGKRESTYRIFHWGGFHWRHDVSRILAIEPMTWEALRCHNVRGTPLVGLLVAYTPNKGC